MSRKRHGDDHGATSSALLAVSAVMSVCFTLFLFLVAAELLGLGAGILVGLAGGVLLALTHWWLMWRRSGP
jgi:hypothetical protein